MRSTTAMLMGVAGLLVCVCPPLLMGLLSAASKVPIPQVNGLILLPYLAVVGVTGMAFAVAAFLAGISGVIIDVFLVVRIFTRHLQGRQAPSRPLVLLTSLATLRDLVAMVLCAVGLNQVLSEGVVGVPQPRAWLIALLVACLGYIATVIALVVIQPWKRLPEDPPPPPPVVVIPVVAGHDQYHRVTMRS